MNEIWVLNPKLTNSLSKFASTSDFYFCWFCRWILVVVVTGVDSRNRCWRFTPSVPTSIMKVDEWNYAFSSRWRCWIIFQVSNKTSKMKTTAHWTFIFGGALPCKTLVGCVPSVESVLRVVRATGLGMGPMGVMDKPKIFFWTAWTEEVEMPTWPKARCPWLLSGARAEVIYFFMVQSFWAYRFSFIRRQAVFSTRPKNRNHCKSDCVTGRGFWVWATLWWFLFEENLDIGQINFVNKPGYRERSSAQRSFQHRPCAEKIMDLGKMKLVAEYSRIYTGGSQLRFSPLKGYILSLICFHFCTRKCFWSPNWSSFTPKFFSCLSQ